MPFMNKFNVKSNVKNSLTGEKSFNTEKMKNGFIAHTFSWKKYTSNAPNHHKIVSNIHKNATSVETFTFHASSPVSFEKMCFV